MFSITKNNPSESYERSIKQLMDSLKKMPSTVLVRFGGVLGSLDLTNKKYIYRVSHRLVLTFDFNS